MHSDGLKGLWIGKRRHCSRLPEAQQFLSFPVHHTSAALVIESDNLRHCGGIITITLWLQLKKIAVHYLPTFRLFFEGGVSNDYRLRENVVEFRTNEGKWRALDDSDLAIHFRFDTEIARWLRRHSLEANPHGKISR